MRELNEHEIIVTEKVSELYDNFMEDLLDLLDGEKLSYTEATLLAIVQEIIGVTKDIKEIFGKNP